VCQQTTTSCKRWPVTNGMDHRTVKYKNYEDIKQYTIFTIARWTHYPWIILRSQIQKCVFSSVNYLIFNHKTFRWLVYTTTRQLYWQSRVQYPIKKNCAFNFLHYGFCSPIFTIFSPWQSEMNNAHISVLAAIFPGGPGLAGVSILDFIGVK